MEEIKWTEESWWAEHQSGAIGEVARVNEDTFDAMVKHETDTWIEYGFVSLEEAQAWCESLFAEIEKKAITREDIGA